MRISLALKSLLRTPLKTLMTFLLIAATSYLLFFSVAEYVVTAREFKRVASYYKGIGAVESEPEYAGVPPKLSQIQTAAGTDVYLYTDARVGLNPYGEAIDQFGGVIEPDGETVNAFGEILVPSGVVLDKYIYDGLSRADIDAISQLPNVSGTSARYMTAGLSPDITRLSDRSNYYNYTARFVAEVTFQSFYEDPLIAMHDVPPKTDGKRNIMVLSAFKVLAGDPAWFKDILPDYNAGVLVEAHEYGTDYPAGSRIGRIMSTATDSRIYMTWHYGGDYYDEVYSREFLESLIPGERYIIVGRLEPAADFTGDLLPNTRPVMALSDPSTFGWWPQMYPVKDSENYMELEQFKPLRDLIEITNADLHTLDVVYTGDMTDIMRVAEGNMLLSGGRFLTDDDSVNNANVCLVSAWSMDKNGLKLGDKISLKLGDKLFEQNAALGAVASVRGRYADKFTDEIEFEIVGSFVDIVPKLVQAQNVHWNYNDDTVFVPSSFLPVVVPDDHKLTPGEFSIKVDSRDIISFLYDTRPIIENELGLTLYFNDGGWLSIEKQISHTDDLSIVRLALFSLSVLIAIGLTVFLFIMRKRKEYAIMRALGTPRSIANRSLIIPLGAIAVLALIAGNLLAFGFSGNTVKGALAAYSQLGIETDSAVPVSVVALSVVCELAALIIVAALGLFRIGRKSPLELLQASTNR